VPQSTAYSPTLADKVAIRTGELSAADIAVQVVAVVRPDIYRDHPRHELERLASGDAVRELQAELDAVREDLVNFQCPHCGALQTEHSIVDNFEEDRGHDEPQETPEPCEDEAEIVADGVCEDLRLSPSG